MSQTAPSSDKTGKQAASPLVPPDERFWQHYSPHGEFPLSSAGSLVLHLLVFGLLVLMAWVSAALFSHASRSLPVEAVRLDLGGGGGNPHGRGDGPNNGEPVEAANQPNEGAAESAPPEEASPPKLTIDPAPKVHPKFEEPSGRPIRQTDETSAIQRLAKRAKQLRLPGSTSSGYGKGGTGSGGGSGDGTGPGVGSGRGPGVATPTQREKRMLRWSMLFNTNNSSDYIAQLRGLGAILAIPVREGPNGCDYKIVRDLSARPAKLLDEDIKEIQRMVYWIDEKADSVQGVMSVLQVPQRPSHFLAFMPPELEEKLLHLEIAYLNKRHRGRGEDDILSTKFRIKVRSGKYEPEVIDQQVK